jgi:hypothetical protein
MPLYMCPALHQSISAALRERMQGKTYFNFRSDPSPELIAELKQLAEDGFRQWTEKELDLIASSQATYCLGSRGSHP